jgi:hypothetical protein
MITYKSIRLPLISKIKLVPFATASPTATASTTAAASPTTTKASRKRKRAIGLEAEEVEDAERSFITCDDDENGFELNRIYNYWFRYEGEKKVGIRGFVVLFKGYIER